MLRAAALGLKFLLEFAALVAFGVWGAHVGRGPSAGVLAIGLPLAGVVLWGVFAAPKSGRRLQPRARIPFELCFFGLALVALAAAGLEVAATVFGLALLVTTALLTALGEWQA